ncbi:MIP/aquaporin family protein [Galbitalea sp. SE-J8]|uniref:MIP/aquaporin family protein n=1 Tax=Galbitalea sp. SE-J8 TaxID=3054952 RepID=UPI00259D1234|nr:MIP/aquaporin family protein [Galbitalea sp. SE-J8]MDM4761418.1 MIP/aquaporin family protein [Galbitalea sp. SE-J8]
MDTNLGLYFLSEVVGTALLLLLGTGVVANVLLAKTKGNGGGFLLVNFGWGLAVFAGVVASQYSGAQLNPAVSIALLVLGDITVAQFFIAVLAQLVGAILGAVLCWLSYRNHFDEEPDPGAKLAVFSTGPAIRSYGWNLITEIIATFVLVFGILAFSDAHFGEVAALGPLSALAVALLVVGIGASLGGPTGYAINPARDLGPRIAHAILPIKGKGSSDWSYSWVPVVGPLVGGLLAAGASTFALNIG